jgi:hypothetical protein
MRFGVSWAHTSFVSFLPLFHFLFHASFLFYFLLFTFSTEIKRPGSTNDSLFPSSTKVENAWKHTSALYTSSWRCAKLSTGTLHSYFLQFPLRSISSFLAHSFLLTSFFFSCGFLEENPLVKRPHGTLRRIRG